MRVAFFGTPAFAVPTLTTLAASSHSVVAVVTQPDRPRGRGQKVRPSEVKVAAEALGVPVFQPERMKDVAFLDAFDQLNVDLGVVAAYGKILPQSLLDRPRVGFINVHASLLPRWRGAAPVHRAILAGDRETGVTIMRVVLALDAGPMLARVALEIGRDETSVSVEERLGQAGAAVLVETIDRLAVGPVPEEIQNEALVTYAHRLERTDGRIDWTRPAQAIHDQIRGLQPWPLASAALRGQRLRLVGSHVQPTPSLAAPGTVAAVTADGLEVATGEHHVVLTRVQPDGRPVMSVRDFLNGRSVSVGDRFVDAPT